MGRMMRGRVIAYIDFQNGGRPPSWIWYDVITDHPRLAFNGYNSLLKLHVDRFNILRDIAILPARRKRYICYGNVAGWLGDCHPPVLYQNG